MDNNKSIYIKYICSFLSIGAISYLFYINIKYNKRNNISKLKNKSTNKYKLVNCCNISIEYNNTVKKRNKYLSKIKEISLTINSVIICDNKKSYNKNLHKYIKSNNDKIVSSNCNKCNDFCINSLNNSFDDYLKYKYAKDNLLLNYNNTDSLLSIYNKNNITNHSNFLFFNAINNENKKNQLLNKLTLKEKDIPNYYLNHKKDKILFDNKTKLINYNLINANNNNNTYNNKSNSELSIINSNSEYYLNYLKDKCNTFNTLSLSNSYTEDKSELFILQKILKISKHNNNNNNNNNNNFCLIDLVKKNNRNSINNNDYISIINEEQFILIIEYINISVFKSLSLIINILNNSLIFPYLFINFIIDVSKMYDTNLITQYLDNLSSNDLTIIKTYFNNIISILIKKEELFICKLHELLTIFDIKNEVLDNSFDYYLSNKSKYTTVINKYKDLLDNKNYLLINKESYIKDISNNKIIQDKLNKLEILLINNIKCIFSSLFIEHSNDINIDNIVSIVKYNYYDYILNNINN